MSALPGKRVTQYFIKKHQEDVYLDGTIWLSDFYYGQMYLSMVEPKPVFVPFQ